MRNNAFKNVVLGLQLNVALRIKKFESEKPKK